MPQNYRYIWFILKIKVDEDGKIIDAKFKTFGCGSAIASSSLATEWIKGKSVIKLLLNQTYKSVIDNFILILIKTDEAMRIKNTDIAKELCLPPVKLHCSSNYI